MSKILVVTEDLERLSQQFTRFTNELQSIEQSLHRALSDVNWESRYRSDMERKWDAIRRSSTNLRQDTYRLAQYLVFISQAFREADEAGKILSKPEYQKLDTRVPSDLSFPKNPPKEFFEFMSEKVDSTLEIMNPKRILHAIETSFDELTNDAEEWMENTKEFWSENGKEIGLGVLEIALGAIQMVESIGIAMGVIGLSAPLGPIGAAIGISLGTYLFLDGASGVTGGISRIKNAIDGNPDTKGDTGHFLKNGYQRAAENLGFSKESGEAVYNTISISTGLIGVPIGIKALLKQIDDMESGVRAGINNWDTYVDNLDKIENFISGILRDYLVFLPGGAISINNASGDLGEFFRKQKQSSIEKEEEKQ